MQGWCDKCHYWLSTHRLSYLEPDPNRIGRIVYEEWVQELCDPCTRDKREIARRGFIMNLNIKEIA